jgi:drug/metabolite transporter (DMT)-like permease
MTLAFLALALVYRKHWARLERRVIVSGAVVGLFLAGGYELQTAGLKLTTPSKSAFITGLVVVLVPLMCAVPALRTRTMHAPRWNAFLGAFAAFGGILLLTVPAGAPLSLGSIGRGDLLTLGCSVSFALHMLALAHTSPRVPYEQLALLQIGFAALFMAVCLPVFEPHPLLHLTTRVVVALAVASLLATAAAFTIQSWAQQFLQPTHTAVILTLEPVFAWLTSFLLLGERLGMRSGAGALLILAGIGITELFPGAVQPTAHEAAA